MAVNFWNQKRTLHAMSSRYGLKLRELEGPKRPHKHKHPTNHAFWNPSDNGYGKEWYAYAVVGAPRASPSQLLVAVQQLPPVSPEDVLGHMVFLFFVFAGGAVQSLPKGSELWAPFLEVVYTDVTAAL